MRRFCHKTGLGLAIAACACETTTLATSPALLEASDGGVVAIASDLDASAITSIATSLPLTPSFALGVHDYYVQCATGLDVVTVAVTAGDASTSTEVAALPDQAIVVAGAYWIRCLPPDFPPFAFVPHGAGPTPGYYLLDDPGFLMVLDTNGVPVWYARGGATLNLDSQRTNLLSFVPDLGMGGAFGTDPLSYFELRAFGTPTTITTVQAVLLPIDGHELRLLPNGDSLIFAYPIRRGVDLTALGLGSDENMADCEIQEIDPGGNLVWSWVASDHVDPFEESLETLTTTTLGGDSVVDVFHCNSIDVDPSGNLLVSMRQTNAVFYVDKTSGTILWKLGGRAESKDGAEIVTVTTDPQGPFSLQHDARLLPSGDVTLFDDHGASPGVARCVEYALDLAAGTASVAWQYLGTDQSQFEGSCRREPDGETVIGWGAVITNPRTMTEVDPSGNDVLDLTVEDVSYRAVKVPLDQLDIDLLRANAAH